MKSKGRQEREWPINSEFLSRSPLCMTGTSSHWGAWETVTHMLQSKTHTQGVKELAYSSTDSHLSFTAGFSCVWVTCTYVHVCVCTCKEGALVPWHSWPALPPVKWALSGRESPQAEQCTCRPLEARQCALKRRGWRDVCRVTTDYFKD